MHESGMIRGLVSKIGELADLGPGERVAKVTVTLGALSQISPGHFREHFEAETPGTLAEGAELVVTLNPDTTDPRAQEIVLDEIEVEETGTG